MKTLTIENMIIIMIKEFKEHVNKHLNEFQEKSKRAKCNKTMQDFKKVIQ
jgi:hypothetical protein